jgi:hypothetical protein
MIEVDGDLMHAIEQYLLEIRASGDAPNMDRIDRDYSRGPVPGNKVRTVIRDQGLRGVGKTHKKNIRNVTTEIAFFATDRNVLRSVTSVVLDRFSLVSRQPSLVSRHMESGSGIVGVDLQGSISSQPQADLWTTKAVFTWLVSVPRTP